jgi:hypothetical protein
MTDESPAEASTEKCHTFKVKGNKNTRAWKLDTIRKDAVSANIDQY